jgi:hypothetical protein
MQVAGPDHWRCTVRSAAGEQCALIQGHAGDHATDEQARNAPPPPVVVRAYRGPSQADASALLAGDASALATLGYRATSQAWAGPSVARLIITPLAVTFAGLVIFGVYGALGGVVIGLLYVLLSNRKGTLTVTYQRESQ